MLTIHDVTIQNFLSYGDNPTRLTLDNFRMLGVSGRNSAGKSTIVESITFALFGKSFRGLTKSNLINTTNKKGALVTLNFTVNSTKYKVTRGIKPDVFTIEQNGSLLDESAASKDQQAVLESILGFDYTMFIKTIALGYANYTPFMVMTAAQRRVFVETALGLSIFTDLNKVVKADASANQATILDLNKKLSIKQATLETHQSHNEKSKVAADSLVAERKEKLAEFAAAIKEKKKAITDLENQIYDHQYCPDVHKTNADLLRQYTTELATNESERNRLTKEYTKVETEINCPTCGSPFDTNHRKQHLDELKQKLAMVNENIDSLTYAMHCTDDTVRFIDAAKQELDGLKRSLEQLRYTYSQDVTRAKAIVADIDHLQAPIALVDTKPLETEIERLERDLGALLVKQEEYQIAIELLKDSGIKASIIEKYIPVLNNKVNEMLDMIGFGVRLKFDSEFNETLTGRYADEFSYNSLSQGERERMNLSIMFAWQQVMQMASGIDCNVLILDEIGSSSLDGDGVAAMFAILEKSCSDKNVIIITHDSNALAMCGHVMQVRKENGFTKIEV